MPSSLNWSRVSLALAEVDIAFKTLFFKCLIGVSNEDLRLIECG